MTVYAVQNYAANSSSPSTSSDQGLNSASELSNRFLTLLVTQLQNQDPMNPMDNSQITSQLAQLSTVQGITDLNSTVNGLVTQLQSSQAIQGAGLVGKSVLVEGNALDLGSSGGAGAVDLASSADSVTVSIMDSAGNVVKTLNLGPQSAGMATFTWDGQDGSGNSLSQGTYTFDVTAKAAGDSVGTTPYAVQLVRSVSMGSSGLNLDLQDLGSTALTDIHQIF